MIKLDMKEVREGRFKELMYQQRASIICERVETNNSCVTNLIFSYFFFIIFLSSFFPPIFIF
jgi:hypothetical protein